MKLNNDIAFNSVFWLLYFFYQWFGLASLYGDYNGYFINACMALPVSLIFSILSVHVFFRRIYQNDRKAAFWIAMVVSAFLLLLIRRYINYYIIYPHYFPMALHMPFFSAGKFLVDFVNLYTVTGLYALYYFIRYWYKEKHRVQELLQQKTIAELDLLKSQVQPHFVFNTLNNIYGTALRSSPETAALIAHLSGFLHYNLYDASKDTIVLSEELAYIKHYIELQKNRYGDRVDVSLNIFAGTDDLRLTPLLLLPLVENAFKHGVAAAIEKSWVSINVSAKPGMFSIAIENSCDRTNKREISKTGGIGLANVRKRLQLMYPGKHNLEIIEEHNSYLVIVEIQIENNDSLFNS